jgi:bifunctional DNase/RNase
MDVEVELSRIIINEASDQQIIVLKERDGQRSFPVVIGIVEIFAIDRRLKGIAPPRPMTHELIDNIFDGLDAKIEKLVINDMINHTFYAVLHLKKSDGEVVQIDCRPSDGIALSISAKAPIFVADHVFDRTSQ